MGDEALNAVPRTEAEVDSLLGAIDKPSEGWGDPTGTEVPEAQAAPEAKPETVVAPPTPAQQQAFKIKWRGAEREIPADKVTQYLQQGYDYSQRMFEFNQKNAVIEQDRQKFEAQNKEFQGLQERMKQYQEVENYIKTDPTWWEHVRTSYAEKRGAGNGQPIPPIVQELSQKIQELSAKDSQRETLLRQQKEDTELNQEVADYRKEMGDLQWNNLDDRGYNLERQILEHAQTTGTKSFRVAANDYLHDELIKRAATNAKEEAGKKLQEATKKGLGPITDKPQSKQLKKPQNVRSQSYEALAEEALAEFGIA